MYYILVKKNSSLENGQKQELLKDEKSLFIEFQFHFGQNFTIICTIFEVPIFSFKNCL